MWPHRPFGLQLIPPPATPVFPRSASFPYQASAPLSLCHLLNECGYCQLSASPPECCQSHEGLRFQFYPLLHPLCQEHGTANFVNKLTYIIPRLPRQHSGKESACQCRRHKRLRFDPWVRKIPCSRKWKLQYSCQENSLKRGHWLATVHGVAKSQT